MPPININQHDARDEIQLGRNERIAICRCWQSTKFPYCDGKHRCFNDENNDNLGPIIVTGPDYQKPDK